MPYFPNARPVSLHAPFVRPATGGALGLHHHQTSVIGGHTVRHLPAQIFAMGSRLHGAGTYRMVYVAPVRMAVTPLTIDSFHQVIPVVGKVDPARLKHPACISWFQGAAYMRDLNQGLPGADRAGFPKEAENEAAARGPAVDVRALMEEKGWGFSQLKDWLQTNDSPLEHFVSVLDLSAQIYADHKAYGFEGLIKGGSTVFAWRRFATLSGTLNPLEVWYGQNDTAPVSQTERLNANGLSDMAGNVSEWCGDVYDSYETWPQVNPFKTPDGENDNRRRVIRSGSWSNSSTHSLAVACRLSLHPEVNDGKTGIRLAFEAAP